MTTPFQQRADARRAKIVAEVDAAKKTLEDATSVGAGFWVSYIFLMFYIAVSAGAVTHVDLLLENPVKLPFLNLDLPLLGFYFLAPILFVIMHMFTLSKLVILSEKAKRFLQALEKLPAPQAREKLRQSLPSNIFVQFMAGPTEISGGGFGGLLRLMGWITMAIAPVVLLLFVQAQFLPYHSFLLNQEQRMLLFVDLFLIWWLWGRALQTPMIAPPVDPVIEVEGWRKVRQKLVSLWQVVGMPMGVAASLAALIFSSHVASFPMEWKRPPLAFAPPLETMRASLTEWVFGTEKVFSRWPYNTLQLEEFNIFEALKLEDQNKLGGRDFTIRLRERRLEGANLSHAKLGKADLREAKLQGATLNDAELQGATLNDAELQGATLDNSKLQGATLDGAQLQGATLKDAELQGATLKDARLQGATFDIAQLQGATLTGAQLQGATLDGALLQGATLWGAELQGATLTGAQLQGATLWGAQLQGATLDDAELQGATLWDAELQGATLDNAQLQGATLKSAGLQGATLDNAQLQGADLSNALVWRAKFSYTDITDARAVGLNWKPVAKTDIGDPKPWTQASYQALRNMLTTAIPEGEARSEALKQIDRLICTETKGKSDCVEDKSHPEIKSLTDEAYAARLAELLKALVCGGKDDSIHILRGIVRDLWLENSNRLYATAANAPKLIDDILKPKTPSDCPVSAALTAEDKARLLKIKQQAEKKFPPKPAPAKAAKAK